jgi:outer membrane receptor for Fe3+-dicitrate
MNNLIKYFRKYFQNLSKIGENNNLASDLMISYYKTETKDNNRFSERVDSAQFVKYIARLCEKILSLGLLTVLPGFQFDFIKSYKKDAEHLFQRIVC